MNYAQQLQTLHRAIIDGAPQQAVSVVKPVRADRLSALSRVSLYSDGYITRLINATSDDYPALQHYMGETGFQSLMADYVRHTPSHHWDLNHYSLALPDFMAHAGADNAVTAIARVESAIAQTFWAQDSVALEAGYVATLGEEGLGHAKFTLRTASQLLSLEHGANAYITAFRARALLDDISSTPEYLLIVRHHNSVHRHVLDAQEHALLSSLAHGASFGDALSGIADHERLVEALPHYIARWLEHGFFRANIA